MSGITFLKQNPSKLGWDSPIRKMVCGLSFLLWLALLQTSLAVNVPGPNGTVVTQILSATSSNPEVKVVEDRDLGKILVYPPQPKEFTVKIIARIMYPDDQYLEKISTVMVGGAGVTIESDEIRNSLILATLKVAPGASGGRFSITYENEDNPNHKGCNVRLLPVEIVPDDDQPGKTGDQIPSNKGGTGEKHYVSPKKSAEIADDFVVLKAKGIDKGLFDQILEWECAPAANGSVDPNDSTKYRVKRDATGKTVVKLKTKDGGQEVDLMNVWVVWSDFRTRDVAIRERLAQGFTIIEGGYEFFADIKPVNILKDADRPDLTGANQTPVPGGNHLDGRPLKGGADKKWDISRQTRQRRTIPAGFNVNNFLPPIALYQDVLNYPNNNLVGNDDAGVGDEDNNPYNNPIIDALYSYDFPTSGINNNGGNKNDEVTLNIQFREIARLEINKKWYRVSDFQPWRFVQKFKKVEHDEAALGVDINGDGDQADKIDLWRNNGSLKQLNNNGW